MPARGLYHDALKNALVKDGWTVTHDPLRLTWGPKDMYVDFGAEELLTAETAGRKIAVELKSFVGTSEINDVERALGQYCLYRSVLARKEPDRTLYVAIPEEVFHEEFQEPLGFLLREEYRIPLIDFDPQQEVLLQWIP